MIGCEYFLRSSNSSSLIPFRCVKYGVDPPSGLLDGLGQGLGAAAYEVAGGFYDLVAKPIHGGLEGGITGAAVGMAQGFVGLIARPIKGGGILIDKVSTSISGDQIRRNRTVKETVDAEGGKRFRLNFFSEGDITDANYHETRSDTDEDLSAEQRKIEEVILCFTQHCHLLKIPLGRSKVTGVSQILDDS